MNIKSLILNLILLTSSPQVASAAAESYHLQGSKEADMRVEFTTGYRSQVFSPHCTHHEVREGAYFLWMPNSYKKVFNETKVVQISDFGETRFSLSVENREENRCHDKTAYTFIRIIHQRSKKQSTITFLSSLTRNQDHQYLMGCTEISGDDNDAHWECSTAVQRSSHRVEQERNFELQFNRSRRVWPTLFAPPQDAARLDVSRYWPISQALWSNAWNQSQDNFSPIFIDDFRVGESLDGIKVRCSMHLEEDEESGYTKKYKTVPKCIFVFHGEVHKFAYGHEDQWAELFVRQKMGIDTFEAEADFHGDYYAGRQRFWLSNFRFVHASVERKPETLGRRPYSCEVSSLVLPVAFTESEISQVLTHLQKKYFRTQTLTVRSQRGSYLDLDYDHSAEEVKLIGLGKFPNRFGTLHIDLSDQKNESSSDSRTLTLTVLDRVLRNEPNRFSHFGRFNKTGPASVTLVEYLSLLDQFPNCEGE